MARTDSLQGRMAGTVHIYPVRVYFEDTDVGGVVYYANYLKFAERARTEMLRQIGYSHADMMEQDKRVFAVRRCEAEYLRPAHLDEALEVHTGNIDMEAAGISLDQRVKRNGEDLVSMRVRLACLGPTGRPTRLPAALRAALSACSETAEKTGRNAAGQEDGKETRGMMDDSTVKERA